MATPSDKLGPFEFQVLSVLMQHPRDAYGVTLLDRIAERSGRAPSVGALYTTLERMQKKGFVRSWWGEPTALRGGRRKRYFEITAAGQLAFNRHSKMLHQFAGTGTLVPQGA